MGAAVVVYGTVNDLVNAPALVNALALANAPNYFCNRVENKPPKMYIYTM